MLSSGFCVNKVSHNKQNEERAISDDNTKSRIIFSPEAGGGYNDVDPQH
jgi:hypothetical protein